MPTFPLLVQTALADLGQRITIARKARGHSQAEFAALSGLGLSTVVGIEAGHPGVAVGNVAKALDTLGLLGQLASVADVSQDPFVVEAGLARLAPKRTARSKGPGRGG